MFVYSLNAKNISNLLSRIQHSRYISKLWQIRVSTTTYVRTVIFVVDIFYKSRFSRYYFWQFFLAKKCSEQEKLLSFWYIIYIFYENSKLKNE